MKVAVLGGAGAMGSGIVKDLLCEGSKGVEKVIVADYNIKKARDFVAELKNDRLEAEFIDITNEEKTIELLKRVDVCANAVAFQTKGFNNVVNMACQAGCHYLDLGMDMDETIELKNSQKQEEFVRKGVSAILDMGSAPGTTDVLAEYCAERLDKVEKLNVYVAIKHIGPESPVFVPPYDILTLIWEYVTFSYQYIDGKLMKMPPLSGSQSMDLPEPFGRTEFVHTSHGEPVNLSFTYSNKGIREATWRLHLPDWCDKVMSSLISCGFGDKEPIKIGGVDIIPEKFLEALIRRNIEKNKENKDKIPVPTFEEVEYYELVFAIGEGEKAGKKIKITVQLNKPHDKFYEGYSEPLTSMSASIGAQMLGKGEIPAGIWFPEECIDTKKFFEELKKRRFKIAVTTEEEVC